MTTNQWVSLVLLLGRVLTVIILAVVIKKQYRVLKVRHYPELNQLRSRLLTGSIILICGNIVPITIDVFGLFGKGSFGLLLAYVVSNNLTAILSAYMIWSNLRLAERIKLIHEGK